MKILIMKAVVVLYFMTSCIYLNAEDFNHCTPPAIGNWVITADCTLTESAVIRGNVFIQNNATLTIEAKKDLNIELSTNRIEIEDGSHIIIEDGGRIHTLMIDDTDGRVGYYLKEVNGPVSHALNESVTFYPASTIKVLQHVHAMITVQAGSANLTTSILTVCPDSNTNCSNSANSNATCGANTINETLSTALNRMMEDSDNQSTNAVQEFFGGGNAATGRNLMNETAQNILGLSNQTVLQHKFACGNIANDPFNTASLEDLAEIYEEIGEDNNVLSGSSKTNFYNLMINESNSSALNNELNDIIDEENLDIGLSSSSISSFKSRIDLARKAGTVTCCLSNAGWVELPLSNGTSSKQYVFAVFIDNFTNNNVNMNEIPALMLRKAIREALNTWN